MPFEKGRVGSSGHGHGDNEYGRHDAKLRQSKLLESIKGFKREREGENVEIHVKTAKYVIMFRCEVLEHM